MLSHSHTYTHQLNSQLEQFSILLQGYFDMQPGDLRIQPLTFRLADDALCFLSHNRPMMPLLFLSSSTFFSNLADVFHNFGISTGCTALVPSAPTVGQKGFILLKCSLLSWLFESLWRLLIVFQSPLFSHPTTSPVPSGFAGRTQYVFKQLSFSNISNRK